MGSSAQSICRLIEFSDVSERNRKKSGFKSLETESQFFSPCSSYLTQAKIRELHEGFVETVTQYVDSRSLSKSQSLSESEEYPFRVDLPLAQVEATFQGQSVLLSHYVFPNNMIEKVPFLYKVLATVPGVLRCRKVLQGVINAKYLHFKRNPRVCGSDLTVEGHNPFVSGSSRKGWEDGTGWHNWSSCQYRVVCRNPLHKGRAERILYKKDTLKLLGDAIFNRYVEINSGQDKNLFQSSQSPDEVVDVHERLLRDDDFKKVFASVVLVTPV